MLARCLPVCHSIYYSLTRDLIFVFYCSCNLHTQTHTRLMALYPGLPGWAGTRKVKPIWILLKQETVSGSGISWAICKSAPRSRQITMPATHCSVFLQAGCPSLPPNQQRQSTEGTEVYIYTLPCEISMFRKSLCTGSNGSKLPCKN